MKIAPLLSLIYYVTTIYMMRMSSNKERPVNVAPESISEFISQCSTHIIRGGKDMSGFFIEEPEEDSKIYEVYELESSGHLKLAVTIMKPGKAGDEYFMTKGHYHEDENAGEVYFGLKGKGLLLLQTKEGQTDERELTPGAVASIPPGWAHRSVNIGDEDFVFLAVYPALAGHDYGAIEKNGFIKRVVEVNGEPRTI
jgi:glucose-6-phosphate isomerase